MTDPTSTETSSSKASYWVLVLSDWRRAEAMVTVTLKSGRTLGPGKVKDNGATLGVAVLHDDGMVYGFAGWRRDRDERKWNVDLDEIAAVEAVATR